jgi:hypothetical protein
MPGQHRQRPGRDRTDAEPRTVTGQALPPELYLAGYPTDISEIAERLRAIVREAVPEAIERVRTGWRLIGYDVPIGRRTRYFAFVAPEPEHVHLGFEYGAWMSDPDNLLLGAHLALRKVRFVTYLPGDPIPTAALAPYVREAAELAAVLPNLPGRKAASIAP